MNLTTVQEAKVGVDDDETAMALLQDVVTAGGNQRADMTLQGGSSREEDWESHQEAAEW